MAQTPTETAMLAKKLTILQDLALPRNGHGTGLMMNEALPNMTTRNPKPKLPAFHADFAPKVKKSDETGGKVILGKFRRWVLWDRNYTAIPYGKFWKPYW